MRLLCMLGDLRLLYGVSQVTGAPGLLIHYSWPCVSTFIAGLLGASWLACGGQG